MVDKVQILDGLSGTFVSFGRANHLYCTDCCYIVGEVISFK